MLETLKQIATTLTTLVLALSGQVGNLSQQVNSSSQLAQVAQTPAYVQGIGNSDYGANVTVSFSNNVVAGNVIAVMAGWYSESVTLNNVTDNCNIGGTSNSYTIVDNPTTNSGRAAMAYAVIGKSGSCTVSVSLSNPSNLRNDIVVHEVSGIDISSPLDKHAMNSQSGPGTSANAVTSGNVVTTQNGEYIFGGTWSPSGSTITAGTGYTSRTNSGTYINLTEDRIQTSAGSIAATFTSNGYIESITGVMAFKPASSGSGDTQSPSTPTNLSATTVSSSQINLSWTASTDNMGVSGYKIYRAGTQIGTSATNSYSDTGLTASTQYSYTVSAYDAAGNNSPQSSSASATTQVPAPTSPVISSFSASPSTITSGQSSTLSWSVSNATSLSITPGNPSTSSGSVTVNPTVTTTYTLTATNATGNITAQTTITVTQPDTTSPSTPTNLSATTVSSSQINLSWTASTDNIAVTGYKIYRGGVQIGTATTNSYSDTGLSASTQYSYTVSAYDAAGNNSSQSSSASATTQAQQTGTYPWLGILDPSRAIDWSKAGATIPTNRTQCATSQCNTVLSGTVTAVSINAALASAPANTYVLIPSGTYTLSSGLTFANKSNVTLRGSGSNSTFLAFSSSSNNGNCNGYYICASASDTNYSGSPSNTANWTGTNGSVGTYTQGATSIILSSIANLSVGDPIILDQVDDSSDNGGLWVGCEVSNSRCGNDGPSGFQRGSGTSSPRGQQQFVNVTSISGSGPYTVGITPGIYATNWRSSQSPGAWWTSNPVFGDAVENISLSYGGGSGGILLMNCTNCWVKGIRGVLTGTAGTAWGHVKPLYCNHCTVRDSYLYGNQGDSYSISVSGASDLLVENNIIQYPSPHQMYNSDCEGCVSTYNFSAGTLYGNPGTDWLAAGAMLHSITLFSLNEGNIGSSYFADGYHGSHVLNTIFRSRFDGREQNANGLVTSNTAAIQLAPGSRYFNIIGSILGTPGYHTSYKAVPGADTNWHAVISAGLFEGTGGTDTLSFPTSMWWGNWDSVTNGVRWNASEVPSGLSLYANSVPASQTLPPSFIYSTKPSWWPSGKAWPPIGPDIVGGNVGQCSSGTYNTSEASAASQCAGGSFAVVAGGKVNSIPAMDCYFNIMGGVPNGTVGPLFFDSNTCYGSSSSSPVNGSCSSTPNTCSTGTFSDLTDTQTNYLWSCLGSNGGTTASCSLPITQTSTRFTPGDRIQTTSSVQVRSTPAGTSLGTQSTGAIGTVLSGGSQASLSGTNYYWWNINFDTGVDGWVAEPFLTPSTGSGQAIPGDLNSDGLVNSIDLSLLTSKWNQNYPAYDLSPDGIINSLDYVRMVLNWTP